MPRKHAQWKKLEDAIDPSSFVLPSKISKAMVIKRPDGTVAHFMPTPMTTERRESANNQDPKQAIGTSQPERVAQNNDIQRSSHHDTTALNKTDHVHHPTPNILSNSNVPDTSTRLQSSASQKNTDQDATVISTEERSSPGVKPVSRGSPRSNLDIYAHKYIPFWLLAVNESSAMPVHGPPLQHIDYYSYRLTFASHAFSPSLPTIELPPARSRQLHTHDLSPHTYKQFWQERLHNEYAAQQIQNNSFGLFDTVVREYNKQQYMYEIKIPGVREYAPRIDLGDVLLIRPLQPVLQGNISKQAKEWNERREGLAPGFGGIEHQAVVWSIKRREELVMVRLGQPLHGNPRDLRCNVIIPCQAHKNIPAWRAIDLAAYPLQDKLKNQWLHSMLFPDMADGVMQSTLFKGSFDLQWYDESLNYEQKRAIEGVSKNDYGTIPYLISGPPGTGKTKTLVELAMQLISVPRKNSVTPHLLLCAPSDAAADTLLTRLTTYLPPTRLFRLNNWTRLPSEVPGEVRPYCYIDPTQDLYSLPNFETLMSYQIVVTSCRDANMLLAAGLSNSSLSVMTSRLIHAISPSSVPQTPPLHWTALLLDETAQATEPELLIPITVVRPPDHAGKPRRCPQIVMAGDEHQLGPRLSCLSISGSPNAQAVSAPRLEISLFQRLFERPLYADHPLSRRRGLFRLSRAMLPIIRPPFTNLIRNYRSHPAILTTSSQLFYADTLIPERPDASSLIISWPGWCGNFQSTWPVMFVQNTTLDSVESVTEGDGTGAGSLMNAGEAQTTLRLVKDLLHHVNRQLIPPARMAHNSHRDILTEDEIIVMSPYRAQVTQLRTIFRAAGLYDVRIGPLEAFQGLESRIVFLCTTRTRLGQHPAPPQKFVDEDKTRGLGVVDEPKRFNVAVTRAKEGLIVIGSAEVLTCTRDRCWVSFLEFVRRNGLHMGNIPGSLGRGQSKKGSSGYGAGKLEKALIWAENFNAKEQQQHEEDELEEKMSNGAAQADQRVPNGASGINNNESFKFRLLGRMVDLDESMWGTTFGPQEEARIREEEDRAFDEDADENGDGEDDDEDNQNSQDDHQDDGDDDDGDSDDNILDYDARRRF